MAYSDLSESQRKMYAAAQSAKSQLTNIMTAKDVAEWYDRWYMAAGYKFLTLALMDRYGVRPDYLKNGGEYD